jgi:3-oxoadipate enol-lactonase
MNHAALTSLFVPSKDGVRIHVKKLNAAKDGPRPIILLHALAMSEAMWRDFSQHIQADIPVWGLDMRGHGQSEIVRGPYSTALFAQDILSVIDHLGAKRVHLVGCSMGGTVAMAFASRFTARVASLGLIDTTACYGEGAKESWEKRGIQAHTEGLTSLMKFQVERWFSERFAMSNPDLVGQYLDIFVSNDRNVYLDSCRMLGSADERATLSVYKGPCEVVVGEQDYATPASMSEEIVRILPQAHLTVLNGVRHYSPIEAPERIVSLLSRLWSD